MKLTQAEIIQLLRRRSGMNQGDFGARSFSTSFESGRTKIKNIELGKQLPTESDLANMARVLGAPVSQLKPDAFQSSETVPEGAVLVAPPVLKRFPGLSAYLDMLNKAVNLDDAELIGHITGKIVGLLAEDASAKAAAER